MVPRFSIVVPCYRVAGSPQLAEQCVASVARQTCTDFELLLVDDGSPDDSAAVLAGILAAQPRLRGRSRVLALRDNGGVCAARNAGIAAARGDYVAFLDYDDLWQAEYLAQIECAARARAGGDVFLVRTDFMRVMDGALRVRSSGSLGHLNELDVPEFHAWHLLHNFPVAMGSAVVVARRLYARHPDLVFDPALSRTTAEDILFGFLLLAKGIRPYYVDRPLAVHRHDVARVSRGTAAQLYVDEKSVNDYIGERAGHALMAAVVSARPALAPRLLAQRARLDLTFDLKRRRGSARDWFGLKLCIAKRRGFATLAKQHAFDAARRAGLDALLRRYLFARGGTDEAARRRVETLLAAVTGREPGRGERAAPGGEAIARHANEPT